jgi:hypothetical protein
MQIRHFSLLVLSLLLAVLGYFFFGIVVAIYAGLWLHDEKMYYAQGVRGQWFGASGAALGVLLAWAIWRLGVATFSRRNPHQRAESGATPGQGGSQGSEGSRSRRGPVR